MRATILIGVILALVGCANLTPEQKEAKKEAREYRDQEYFETVYLPKKFGCKGIWVVVSHGVEASRISRRNNRPSYQQMVRAYCAASMSDILY